MHRKQTREKASILQPRNRCFFCLSFSSLFIASKQHHSVLLSKHHCSLPNKRLSSALLFALQDKARMVASPLLLFRGCLVLLALWRWQRIHPNKNQTSWVWIGCLCVGSCLMACLMVSCWMVFLSSLSISFSHQRREQPAASVSGCGSGF